MSPILVVDEAMSPILVVDEAMSPFALENNCSQEVLADGKGDGGTLLNCCPFCFSLYASRSVWCKDSNLTEKFVVGYTPSSIRKYFKCAAFPDALETRLIEINRERSE